MHGQHLGNYAYGMWPVVIFNSFLLVFFVISFIGPKKKFEWRTMGVFIGFIVALFTEMYGFPLTIYFLSSWMGQTYPVLDPFSHHHGHLWLVFLGLADSNIAMTILHIISNLIIFGGFILLHLGWKLIHESKGEKLVTGGVYSHVRHPQYTGLFLITVGFLIQWPSLTTIVMWPILMFAYSKLAMREESAVEKQFGEEYLIYKNGVPAFIPKFGIRR